MSKPSMKYNILSLIKWKLDRISDGPEVKVTSWYYNYIHNRIDCRIYNNCMVLTIFESYGEYPMVALHSVIEDHNGNLLIGMTFDEYFEIVKNNEEVIKENSS